MLRRLLLFLILLWLAGPARAAGRFDRVEAALRAWHPERARPVVEAWLAEDDDDPVAWLAAARLAFYEGRYAEAQAALAEVERRLGTLQPYRAFAEMVSTTAAKTARMRPQRSRHFEVRYVPGPDELLAPFVLETLERALTALHADLGVTVPAEVLPLRVEIYPTIDDFVAVSTLTRQEVRTSGTVALCKFHRMMIVSPRRLARGYRWRDTLNHELVHFLLSRATDNRLPLWLHEGIAKFEERRWRSPVVGELHPIQAAILAEARRKQTYVPFRDMMPSLAKLPSGWQTALAFAEVTLLVKSIVAEGGMPRLREIVAAFSRSPNAGLRALGVASVDELWERFLRLLAAEPLHPPPGYRFIPPSVAEDPEEAEPEPIEEVRARKHTRIGDLLKDEGRWAAAVTEYEKARRYLGYEPAPLALRYAEALLLGRRYAAAAERLERLLQRDPDRATAHWLLGKIALMRKDYPAALAHYETAFAIAPFHDEVLEGLVAAAEGAGDARRLEAYRHTLEVWRAQRGD